MIVRRAKDSLAGLVLAAVLACAGGCEKKVTQENFERIAEGMSQREVEKILGKGEKEEGAVGTGFDRSGFSTESKPPPMSVYHWKEGSKEIVITLKDGKVLTKVGAGL